MRPCVGILLTNAEGLVFAGQRVDRYADAWQMPQGGIENGETPQEASLRELREETGLHPEHLEPLAESADWHDYELPAELARRLWGGRYRGQTQKWFAYRLTAPETAIDITAHDPSEFRCWAWLAATDLAERVVPFKRAIYDRVLMEFADFLA